jgi:YidC/Oxa1 family membrane protein insertase
MLWLLNALSRVTFGNYGVAILILVVLTRLALHPLTKKSQVAMSKMQKFQPEMQKIREKYKDDKAKLNEEMMKLYKQSGSTPVLGCLPMFLQMPIWVALWTALSASVELRHAGFLPFWITDLSAPDELFLFGRVILIPLIGTSIWAFNLLPILLAVAMGLQQKFTPTSTPSSDPQQARTQKIMMYFMTGFMLLIFYNQPSGLNLYIMASTFAGVAEQYVIRKHIRERDAAEAAGETRVSVGKAFRDQRPKKPKGPFRLK